jgi:hypothetical protein
MQPLDNTVRVIVLRGHDGDIQSAINDLRSNIEYEDYDVRVEEPVPSTLTRERIEGFIEKQGWWDGYEGTKILRALAAMLPEAP